MILNDFKQRALIDLPDFLTDPENTAYLVRMGSTAYGAALEGGASDIDVVGFALPSLEDLFPYQHGQILGFGSPPSPFQQWSKHHVKDGGSEYDLTVYSIVKFFHLAAENNPNLLDVLFVPDNCVMHLSEVGKLVRENRRLFLHKGAMHKLRGYAYRQMKDIQENRRSSNEKNQATVAEHGYNTKPAYHLVRLCLQAEQVLEEHDMQLDRNSKMLLSVRRGEWSLEQVENWFQAKEEALEILYAKSTLRAKPDEKALRALLFKCIETRYGSLDAVVNKSTDVRDLAAELRAVLDRY